MTGGDRRRPLPAAPEDHGEADPALAAALAAHAAGRTGRADVLRALAPSRLLVPVVAVADQVARTDAGTAVDKSSHLATVSTTGRDGRRGQLAFTGLPSLRRWDPAARPVAVPARAAARAALDEGADAIVVDLAGPVVVELDRGTLRALADGWEPLDGDAGTVRWALPVTLPDPDGGGRAGNAGI